MTDHGGHLRKRDRFLGRLKGVRSQTPTTGIAAPQKTAPQTSAASALKPVGSTNTSGSDCVDPPDPGFTTHTAPDTDRITGAAAHKPQDTSATASSEPKRNLSKDAFDALPEGTRDEIRNLIPNADLGANEFSSSVPDQMNAVVEIVRTKEKKCESKFWKIKIGGSDFVIKDYIKSTLDILRQVGDIAINFAPVPGSIVWSGVKTIMQMYVDGEAELCALLMVAQSVTPILCRVQAYEEVFTTGNTLQAHLDTLNSVAIDIYGSCFEILAYASKELASKRRRARHLLLEPGKMTNMISELKDLESEHHSAVTLCFTSSTSVTMQKVKKELEFLTDFLAKNEKALKNVEAGVDRLVSDADLDTLTWISPVTYLQDHITIREKRAENTGRWLVQHPSFEDWKNSDSSALFWLRGEIGTGKSVLSSSVIDYFLEDFTNSSEDGGFAYFYCNLQVPDHKETLQILRSYVRQLSTTFRSESRMREELLGLCNKTKRGGGQGLDQKTCAEQIKDSVSLYPRAVIVLDGLDECEEDQRKMLLDVLDGILAQAKVKVFIASRPIQDLERYLACLDQGRAFQVDAMDNLDDIKTYVTQKIQNPGTKWNDVPHETRDLVKTTLLEDSERRRPMFRWVFLQLVQLLQCRSARDIKDRLGKLPKDLNDSYDGIHQRNTENLGPHDLAHVERAFLWVLGVERQPPSYVILQAVCLSPNGDVDDDEVSKETLLGLCQHLLVIDPNSGNFRYTHASVKEWVEDRYSKFRDAELYIAKLCLTHLLTINEDFEPLFNIRNKEGVDGKKSCKLRYSVQDWIRLHWPQYVQAVNDAGTFDADLVRLLKQFLGSPMKSSSQYRRWASWTSSADINTDADSSDSEGRSTGFKAWERFLNRWSKEIQPSEIALFAIVVYGFTDILMEWWESADMDVTIRNGRGGSLLSMTKSLEVIKLLVKRGIDINMRDWFDWNVLARAIQDKDWEIIRFVIETGRAEVNMDSSVMEVTIFSDLEILKYIIERGGADVNRPFENEYPDSEYVGSALAAVAAFGKLDVVKYLVNEAKADVNLKLQHGRYGNALVAAAHGGHLDIVRFFVNEKKVDVNGPMEHGTSGTALQAASAGCHEQVVQLLLEKNAEVNAPGGEFGNALQAISNVLYSEPKWAIVTMLLDKGADVHTLDGGQGSLLYEASYHDRKELVKMLLNKGVDPNVKVQELYGNALQAASAEGNDVVVEMLLDKGANPNAPGGLFDNALEAASLGGNDVVVKILRERGAEGEYSKRPAWSFEDDE